MVIVTIYMTSGQPTATITAAVTTAIITTAPPVVHKWPAHGHEHLNTMVALDADFKLVETSANAVQRNSTNSEIARNNGIFATTLTKHSGPNNFNSGVSSAPPPTSNVHLELESSSSTDNNNETHLHNLYSDFVPGE